MSCGGEQPLSAYLDGELDAAARAVVEEHLRTCGDCRAELQFLRETSQQLRDYPFENLSPAELDRIHAAVSESVEEPRLLRIGGTIGVLAASVLIVGMAWLKALPTSSPATPDGQIIASAPSESWERMAMTLRPEPILSNDADWMLEQLALGPEDGQP